jgi:hypothetical protein
MKLVMSYMLRFEVKINKYLLLMILIYFLFGTNLFVCFRRDSPQLASAYSFTRFLYHTQKSVGLLWASYQLIAETPT